MIQKMLMFTFCLACGTPLIAADVDLEPCINGEVSHSGNFPTQEMEEQIHAYLEWSSDAPYYLFRVAAKQIGTPYSDN
jgi:hypothetical protein